MFSRGILDPGWIWHLGILDEPIGELLRQTLHKFLKRFIRSSAILKKQISRGIRGTFCGSKPWTIFEKNHASILEALHRRFTKGDLWEVSERSFEGTYKGFYEIVLGGIRKRNSKKIYCKNRKNQQNNLTEKELL